MFTCGTECEQLIMSHSCPAKPQEVKSVSLSTPANDAGEKHRNLLTSFTINTWLNSGVF